MEKIIIRKYTEKDIPAMCGIWNEVVEEGVAFPQEETLTEKTGSAFFASQTYCAVAEETESKNCGALHSAPEQCRPLRSYCKRKLRRKIRLQEASHRRASRKGLPRSGTRRKFQDFAVQRRCRNEYPRAALIREARLYPARHNKSRIQDERRPF